MGKLTSLLLLQTVTHMFVLVCSLRWYLSPFKGDLKYVGVRWNDLLEIYSLFIRSRAEYCSVVFHSSLTQEQTRKIENIQKTSLKVILQDEYNNYELACQLMGLSSLFQRRENWSLTLARRCLKNQEMSRFFPPVTELPQQDLRDRLTFPVGPNTRTLRSYIFRSSFMNYTTNRTERGRIRRRREGHEGREGEG